MKIRYSAYIMTCDDTDIWQRLVQGLKPLTKKSYMPYSPPAKVVIKHAHTTPTDNIAVPQKGHSAWHNLHRREQKRVGRGTEAPQATLDLHGLTLAVAHTQLQQFVYSSCAAQHRLVLVITGKGKISEGGGALRRALPLWLHDASLSPFVIGFRAAHGKHGGDGAYYVVLRSKA